MPENNEHPEEAEEHQQEQEVEKQEEEQDVEDKTAGAAYGEGDLGLDQSLTNNDAMEKAVEEQQDVAKEGEGGGEKLLGDLNGKVEEDEEEGERESATKVGSEETKEPKQDDEEEEEKEEEKQDRVVEEKETTATKKAPRRRPSSSAATEEGPPPIYTTDPKDEDYFASLSQEELEWYEELGPKAEAVAGRKVECTACHRQITNVQGNNMLRHPLLGVVLCRMCRKVGVTRWRILVM